MVVDISGYKVYDNGGQSGAKPKLPIPAGTSIPAKGFYVIVTDVGGESGFGLSSGGEEVWLESAVEISLIMCSSRHGYQSELGRNPDGSQTWELLNVITKGGPNSNAPLQRLLR